MKTYQCDDCGATVSEETDFWFTDWKCPSEIYCLPCGPKHGFPHREPVEVADDGPRSFKVAVKTKGDREWSYNGMRYATSWAASAAGADLAGRWFAVTEWEVHPSEDEPNG